MLLFYPSVDSENIRFYTRKEKTNLISGETEKEFENNENEKVIAFCATVTMLLSVTGRSDSTGVGGLKTLRRMKRLQTMRRPLW